MKEIVIDDITKINAATISLRDNLQKITYLDTSSITDNQINEVQILNLADAPSRAQRKVKNNTIIFSTVRPNLRHFGILENPKDNFIVSTGFATIDVIDKDIDAKYLYYKLTSKSIVEYLHNIAVNAVSAYPSINPSDIANLSFKVPSIQEQRQIASVLSSLDKKIALNSQLNDNLPTLVRSLAWAKASRVAA